MRYGRHAVLAGGLVVLLLAGAAPGAAQGRVTTGDLLISGGLPGSGDSTNPANLVVSDACAANATADVPGRWGVPQFNYALANKSGSWGPSLGLYPSPPSVPADCNAAGWLAARVKKIIDDTVALGVNYCHHHAPAWVPPPQYQVGCELPGNDTCTCSVAGLTTRPKPVQGVDCSNYASFVYNFGFNYYPTSAIGPQACGTSAPGRILPYTRSQIDSGTLAAGDLLFIVGSSTATAPTAVTHVIMWTGITIDFTPGSTSPFANATVVANLAPTSQKAAVKDMSALLAAGKQVYVISDSTWTGPNYRPWAGWYRGAFSHARRIINPDPAWQQSDATVASPDSAGNCLSNLVLRA